MNNQITSTPSVPHVLNSGIYGLVESGVNIDLRIDNVTIDDIALTLQLWGGRLDFEFQDYSGLLPNRHLLILELERNKAKIFLIHEMTESNWNSQKMSWFTPYPVFLPGEKLTVIDNSYIV